MFFRRAMTFFIPASKRVSLPKEQNIKTPRINARTVDGKDEPVNDVEFHGSVDDDINISIVCAVALGIQEPRGVDEVENGACARVGQTICGRSSCLADGLLYICLAATRKIMFSLRI